MPAEQLSNYMTLDTLLERLATAPPVPVADITIDSREIRPGSVFIATAGATHHGIDFLQQAADAGAVACVYDSTTVKDVPGGLDIPLIPVASLAGHLGSLANRYFGSPSEHLAVVGVTGTNGKSTVAWMLAQSLSMLGRICGYGGTLGYGVGEISDDTNMTTPDVIELHRRLADFRDANASHAAIEVSSHALDQCRVQGVRFAAALFTNLTRDHLDYHVDMRAYGEAKAKLFIEHRAKTRIINVDSEFGTSLADRCGNDVITVSTRFDRVANSRPFVLVRSITARHGGSDVRVQTSWGNSQFFVPMPGDYNVANAAIVLAYLLVEGIELADATDVIRAIIAPPGRMQRVPSGSGPATYVDYAHTPNALDAAMHALRAHGRGKLWCVFGCGGERDAGKRPQMGRIAERLADRVIVTNDNPRGESPSAITAHILAGMTDPQAATVIEDRAAAIAWAIAHAGDNDQVLIAGKGHENYQLIAGTTVKFSDYDVAKANLEARVARGGA